MRNPSAEVAGGGNPTARAGDTPSGEEGTFSSSRQTTFSGPKTISSQFLKGQEEIEDLAKQPVEPLVLDAESGVEDLEDPLYSYPSGSHYPKKPQTAQKPPKP